jgi:hypothetical protein
MIDSNDIKNKKEKFVVFYYYATLALARKQYGLLESGLGLAANLLQSLRQLLKK